MDLLHQLENISEYISSINLDDFDKIPRHVKYLSTQMKSVNKNSNYTNNKRNYQISTDVAMFCAKLYPMKPRLRHNGKVHCMKQHHERLRKEELLQLKHRIRKNIATFTDKVVYDMWKSNPNEILPKSILKW